MNAKSYLSFSGVTESGVPPFRDLIYPGLPFRGFIEFDLSVAPVIDSRCPEVSAYPDNITVIQLYLGEMAFTFQPLFSQHTFIIDNEQPLIGCVICATADLPVHGLVGEQLTLRLLSTKPEGEAQETNSMIPYSVTRFDEKNLFQWGASDQPRLKGKIIELGQKEPAESVMPGSRRIAAQGWG